MLLWYFVRFLNNYIYSHTITCMNLVFGTIGFLALFTDASTHFDKFLCMNFVFFSGPGTALVASQKLEDLTQVSSKADERYLTGKEDPLSALVSNATQNGHPECLLQRGKEELTTQPPHPIRRFPLQGLSLAQKRQNDSIVHTCTSADPGKQVHR